MFSGLRTRTPAADRPDPAEPQPAQKPDAAARAKGVDAALRSYTQLTKREGSVNVREYT